MEKEREISKKIRKLQAGFHSYFSKSNVILYDQIYHSVFSSKGKSGFQKQLEAFSFFLEQKELLLSGDDIFAGQIQHYLMRDSQPLPGDGDPEKFDPSDIRLGAVNPPENARATVEMCLNYEFTDEEKQTLSYLETGLEAGYFTHYPVGHAITGFPFILENGWEAVKEKIRARMARGGCSREQEEMGSIMLKTIESCQKYFQRYADRAGELLREADSEDAICRMRRIRDSVNRLVKSPAANFYDALQFSILLQELILTQVKGSMSLGRMDVLFDPYLKSDYDAETEDENSAQELIDAWMLKLAGCINGYQNVTLGGCDENGNYAGNEVSLMILRGARRLGYDQPLLSFRLNENVPEEHWEEILKTLERGGGFPALFWDDTIIRSRTELGVPLGDARDYGIVGCVEPSVCGKEFSNTEKLRINWCKTLELMLFEGKCPVTGKALFLKEKRRLETIKSFPEFLDWYKEELFYAIEKGAEICNLTDRHFYERYPSTLLSVTLEDCIEKLDDCGNKGCRYCNSAINHTGIANAADSLAVIKKIVFEEKKLSLVRLRDILRKDYEGHEELLDYIRENVPRYGNDNAEVDSIAAWLVNETSKKTQEIRNERGGVFLAGYYSVSHHAALGRLTGALPDGKRRGESLANGLSPVQGADQDSPVAVVNSMLGMRQERFANGMVLDLKWNPSFFKNPEHRAFLRTFAELYFRQGGMELQINVVDRATLLDAKRHPENHRNLIVRVSGFSAYFVNLFEELQDEIIRRTEYAGEDGSDGL